MILLLRICKESINRNEIRVDTMKVLQYSIAKDKIVIFKFSLYFSEICSKVSFNIHLTWLSLRR